MANSAAWLIGAMIFTLVIGPASFVMSQSGRADVSDIYIILDFGSAKTLTQQISAFGGTEIGPTRPPLSRMILAPAAVHARLRTAGHILIPAGALAFLCGIAESPSA